MNNGTQRSKKAAVEAYRNRMNAYMQGMKELAGRKQASESEIKKEGAKL